MTEGDGTQFLSEDDGSGDGGEVYTYSEFNETAETPPGADAWMATQMSPDTGEPTEAAAGDTGPHIFDPSTDLPPDMAWGFPSPDYDPEKGEWQPGTNPYPPPAPDATMSHATHVEQSPGHYVHEDVHSSEEGYPSTGEQTAETSPSTAPGSIE